MKQQWCRTNNDAVPKPCAAETFVFQGKTPLVPLPPANQISAKARDLLLSPVTKCWSPLRATGNAQGQSGALGCVWMSAMLISDMS
mmetsp:Transcript_2650/g.5078  ORF Transcript_2650/g.5078 Transcript_2650/m.5078 type:complete len:86 (+) Transcript_2650:277-534(+)